MKYLKHILILKLFILCTAFIFAGQVSAYIIDPTGNDATLLYTGADNPAWNTNKQSIINGILQGAPINLDISNYYEQDMGDQSNGTFDMTYVPDLGGGSHMLVKDGNHTPWWYLFHLTGWDGMGNITLQNFWVGRGGMSHATVYGTPIPEPTTLVLIATGLISFIGFRRRFKN